MIEQNKGLEQEGKKPIPFTIEDVAVVVVEADIQREFKALAERNDVELSSDDYNRLIKLGMVERERHGNKGLDKKQYVRILSNYANKELNDLSRKVGKKQVKGSKKTTPKRQKKKKVKEITRISQAWDL